MNELVQISSEYKCLLAKLQELIRLYRIAKKNDKNNVLQERVKAKSYEIVGKLKSFPAFSEVEKIYTDKVQTAFREIKQEVPSSAKPSKEPLESQKTKPVQPPKKSNFSSVSSNSNFSSSNSNSSAHAVPAAKKQTSIIQQKNKTPSIVDKPKVQPSKSIQSLKSDVMQQNKIPQTLKVMSSPKIQTDSVSSKSSNSIEEAKKESSSISSIQKKQFFQKEKSSGNESFLGLLDQNLSSDGEFNIKLGKQKSEEKIETPQASNISSTPKQDDFDKLSESSAVQNTHEIIANFCKDNKDRLNTEIVFNEDIFDYTLNEQADIVYLIGVNKPQSKKVQKLYACTLMKFSVHEVMKCDDLFQKQTKDFKNNIRTPIGLIIKGDGPAAIQPEHIKFLINLHCPFLVILVLKDFQKYDGVLCHFNENVVDRISFTPRKQLGQTAQELSKKTYVLPFNESHLPKEKTKYVITKHLNRIILSVPEVAPNAITISNNQCIREQKNVFNYKVHQKFLTNLKTENTIYYVTNGVVNQRLSYKNFQAFKAEALTLKPTFPLIFSLTLARDNAPVRKQFFQVLLQCNKIRDPNIFINLSNMGVKKCIVVALKPQVTMEMLNSIQPLQLKSFEKDTPLTYCVLVISKNNFKEFEDSNSEINQLKVPL